MREQRAQGTPSTVLVIVLSAIGILFAGMLLGSARGETPPPPTQVAALVVSESALPTPEPALNSEQGQAAADLGVLTPAPAQEVAFEVGNELAIAALRAYISGSEIMEQQLQNGSITTSTSLASSRRQPHLRAADDSMSEMPPGGFRRSSSITATSRPRPTAPPSGTSRMWTRWRAMGSWSSRSTCAATETLRAWQPAATSPDYTIDAIAALKSLQTLPYVDPDGIGVGPQHGGNLVLRAMLIEPDIKAAVIWAGAGYATTTWRIMASRIRRSAAGGSRRRHQDLNSPRRRRLIREDVWPAGHSRPFWRRFR